MFYIILYIFCLYDILLLENVFIKVFISYHMLSCSHYILYFFCAGGAIFSQNWEKCPRGPRAEKCLRCTRAKKSPRGPRAKKVPPGSFAWTPGALSVRMGPGGTFFRMDTGEPFLAYGPRGHFSKVPPGSMRPNMDPGDPFLPVGAPGALFRKVRRGAFSIKVPGGTF